MKKVLLAIDGITPDQQVFRYAVELCKRIRADLKVFQIINPRKYKEYLKKMRSRAGHARRYLASSMVAATFAEAGEHETAEQIMSEALENMNRLLPETEKEGVQCRFILKSGAPDKEIIDYVNQNRDVVLAIYDSPARGRRDKGADRTEAAALRKIKRALLVPLVTMRS